MKIGAALVAASAPVEVAAVFTRSLAAAAPVQVSRAHLEASSGRAAAVLLTSGNANAATGDAGRAAEDNETPRGGKKRKSKKELIREAKQKKAARKAQNERDNAELGLLVDSKAVLQDHLAGVQRQGETDLALLTDGLSAEREQGITIDVAYRYFSTASRKFIIGDAPGHEQYTRNMVTAASSADAAVVLVDATKLDWKNPQLTLLPQTRRHSLLAHLLRVPNIVFAVNKLDAIEQDTETAFHNVKASLEAFAEQAGIVNQGVIPVSALRGDKDNFGKQVRAMREAKAKVFSGKMQKLSAQSKAQCT